MKKYNTPEMKVAIFNSESVLTASSGAITEFNDFYNTATAKYTTTFQNIMENGVEVSF